MRDIFTPEFEQHAINHPLMGLPLKGSGGCYFIPFTNKKDKTIFLQVVADIGEGWDHVSVSLTHRCPNWLEMDYIKRLFFEEKEVAYQLHVQTEKHIRIHDYCLHLWRPQDQEIPLPPRIMV